MYTDMQAEITGIHFHLLYMKTYSKYLFDNINNYDERIL